MSLEDFTGGRGGANCKINLLFDTQTNFFCSARNYSTFATITIHSIALKAHKISDSGLPSSFFFNNKQVII